MASASTYFLPKSLTTQVSHQDSDTCKRSIGNAIVGMRRKLNQREKQMRELGVNRPSRSACFRTSNSSVGKILNIASRSSLDEKSGQEYAAKINPPPSDFDFREETRETSREVIGKRYPELLDLVEDGSLVVIPRPSDYVERRSDGYREPEIVFLVGTAHISQKSAADVDRVIRAICPENVVVELCRSRAGAMYETPMKGEGSSSFRQWREKAAAAGNSPGSANLMSLGGENFGSAVTRSLQLGGRSALALRFLLARLSQRISDSAGVQSGEEFRSARKAALDVDAQIVLGDRPIEITLRRAWLALSWREKVFLLANLAVGIATSSKIDVSEERLRAMQEDDTLSAMFAEISKRFPSLIGPLVHERDVYIAWSLKRSKAVNGCNSVVGVIGRGHLRGVVYALKNNQENLKFKDLVGPRGQENDNSAIKFVGRLAIETGIWGLLWLVYEKFFSSS